MWFVTMTDKFLSGWGLAEGRINKLIIECQTLEEAEIVAENARNRSEMRYVNVVKRVPNYSSKRYLISYKRYDEMPVWRKPNAFR